MGRVLAVTLALNLRGRDREDRLRKLVTLAQHQRGRLSLAHGLREQPGRAARRLHRRAPGRRKPPYGHHKFEIIAAGVVRLSLLVMAYEVAHGAINRLIEGKALAPELDIWALVVLLATLAVNSGVASWERKRGEELASVMLLGDATHTRSDVLVTSGVVDLHALRGSATKVDVIAALLIAAFITYAGVQVLRANLGYLSDTALLDAGGIDEVARSVPR